MSDEHDSSLDQRAVVAAAIAIAVMIALAAAAAWLAWSAWQPPDRRNGPNGPLDFGVAGSRLESAPRGEREDYFGEKERQLHTWGWVDRQAGIARIPIDEAMALLARQNEGQQARRETTR